MDKAAATSPPHHVGMVFDSFLPNQSKKTNNSRCEDIDHLSGSPGSPKIVHLVSHLIRMS